MLTFQDEEISKGEKKIREWRVKLVGLRNKYNDSVNERMSDRFEDMLLNLDKMKIKVEEMKIPGNEKFETIRDEIKRIDKKIGREFREIKNELLRNSGIE